MACNPETLKHVPLFALLDDDEAAVLAGQVEEKKFASRQRIFEIGEPSGAAKTRFKLSLPDTPSTAVHKCPPGQTSLSMEVQALGIYT